MGYESAAAAARRILGRKGIKITLKRPGEGSVDEIAGTRSGGAETTTTFNCVGLPPGRSADKEIGTLINRRLMEFHLARVSGTLEPQPGDIITWNGVEWPLIWAAVYDPDTSGMLYAKAYGEIGG